MPNLQKLATYDEEGLVRVVVETPRGAEAKMDYDPDTRTFVLAKALVLGLRYPFDWGFVPSTVADDGDPIDVLVIHEATTFPGVVMPCTLIGVLEARQHEGKKSERNDRLIAVPEGSHRKDALEDVRKLPKPMRAELERFFAATDAKEAKTLEFLGWKGPGRARRLLEDARKSFAKKKV